jgi:hypothetical protein
MERRRRRVGSGTPALDGVAARRGAFPLPILLLALLGAAIALLPALRSALASPSDRADGYADIVSAAIQRNWLFVVPGEGDTGDVDGRVERARGGDVPPEFDRFIAVSFLREDMTTLDPAIWRYDGSSLGIDPRAHLVGGAYEGVGGWRGSLLFSDTQVEQQLLDDRNTTAAWLVANPRPGAGGRVRQINLMRAGPAPREAEAQPAAEADIATEVHFIAGSGAGAVEVARIRRIGGHALLRVLRRDRDQVRVRVGGVDATPRGAYGWRVLESGDTITFEGLGPTRRFQFVQSESAISRSRGDARRIREPSLASLAQPVEGAVGSGAQSLRTSIDSRIHGIAQQALVDQAMSLYQADAEGTQGITSFRAAAVLMDGLTGEVAALPSFPAAPEHLHPSQRGSPTHRKMLERNSNFVRMVAGSTAKPPMAMAIVNRFPALTDLRIRGASPFRVLFGLDLGTPVPDQAGGDWDFRSFLARSSNKYAASLMLLGLSDADSLRSNACGGQSNEPFAIGNRTYTCRPVMPFLENVRQGRLGTVGGWSSAPPGWANDLYTLFCINPNSPEDAPPVPSEACLPQDALRQPIWRGALFERPRLLAAASPDREGFGLQLVDKLYEDYVMTILGGNRGRWTTIGLAQAYSRIVTGRGTIARLTPAGDGGEEAQPEQASIGINPQSQQRMLDGLKAVVMEGTGRALLSAGLPIGDELRLFAKTGTPNVSFLGEDARAILQDFARANCGLRLAERVPRPGAAARAEMVVGNDPSVPIERAIAARPDCAERFGPSVDRIAELIGQLNRSQSLARVGVDGEGRVLSIPPNITLTDGTGHLLVLMVGRYRPGTPDTQPCSLRTIAINFQARTPQQRTPAMAYALSLLRNDITRNWFLGTPCGQGQAQGA